MILASFALIKQKYYRSNLTYGFGITEDIPYGYRFNITMGHENDQFFDRSYLGGGFSYAKYCKFPGYLLLNVEFGSFFGHNEKQDRIVKIKLLNIGYLHKINHYSMRNFFELDFQAGYNMSDPDYKAVINGRWTSIVTGLKKEGLKGEQKLTASYQSVLFTPWYFLGFKFALLGYVDLGWVSDGKLLRNPSFYGNIGFGVRIKNESWVFETITIGVACLMSAPKGSDRFGLILDGSDPRVFKNLNPGRPDVIRMDQSPVLFSE